MRVHEIAFNSCVTQVGGFCSRASVTSIFASLNILQRYRKIEVNTRNDANFQPDHVRQIRQ